MGVLALPKRDNKWQLCLCPTKFSCFSQQINEESIFKLCNHCQKTWRNYHEFLSDPQIKLLGYQVSFEELEAGLFLFNHSCNNTVVLPAEIFTHLYDGPIFTERATGTDECPGYCLNKNELRPCPAQCECTYVREVLQIVNNWPKIE